MKTNWDNRFLELAKHISTWSKDRSTQVGAVIVDSLHRVVSLGYNGFPRGCDDEIEDRHQRLAKYLYTEHAERNAIYNATSSLQGCTIYITPLFPCSDCARAIIQTGITRVVCPKPDYSNVVWSEHFKAAEQMFQECGVQVVHIEDQDKLYI